MVVNIRMEIPGYIDIKTELPDNYFDCDERGNIFLKDDLANVLDNDPFNKDKFYKFNIKLTDFINKSPDFDFEEVQIAAITDATQEDEYYLSNY